MRGAHSRRSQKRAVWSIIQGRPRKKNEGPKKPGGAEWRFGKQIGSGRAGKKKGRVNCDEWEGGGPTGSIRGRKNR